MAEQNIMYSIVIPVFNEQECIAETARRLQEVLDLTQESYELIFVNDGSRDRSAEIIETLATHHPSIRLLNFSRNFGHQIAVTAGIHHAAGQAVILIDADLQDPPEVIPAMIKKWKQGYDVVYGKRIKRERETLFKKATAKAFYRLLRSMTRIDIPVDTGDFRLMDRKVCDVLNGLKERNRFIRGLVSWVGFKQTSVEYVRDQRYAGVTKYPFRKMLHFAVDGITSFSYKPLRMASYFGFGLSALSFIYLLIVLYQKLFTDTTIAGWTSIVAMNLFFNGIMLMILGVIGEYIGRIYDESKGRPLYIVSSKVGFDEENAEKTQESSDLV